MEDQKVYAIKSLSMMNHLVRAGNNVIGVGDNENNLNFKVFFFVDTPKLRHDMKNFKK